MLFKKVRSIYFRRTQEGCGGLGGENPAVFPKARPIFQQPFSVPESAQTLAGIAFRAAGKSGIQQRRNLPENVSSKEFRTATAFSSLIECQKHPSVHDSLCSHFLEGLFAILAECSQLCLRVF